MSLDVAAPARLMTAPARSPRPWTVLAVALALTWLLLPILPILLWSAADRWSAPGVLPQAWGLRPWREALAGGLGPAAARSLALGLVVAAVATPLGAIAGRAIGWRESRRPALVALVLLLPVLLPPFAVSMGLDVVLLRLRIPGVVATVVVLVVFALPYCAYTIAAGYAALDPQVEEQARCLGASAGQARRWATLPALTPSLTVAAVLAFLVGWSDYVVALLLGGGRLVTLPVLLGAAASGSGNEPAVAALAVATALPPLLLVVLLGLAARHRSRRTRSATSTHPFPEMDPR